MLGEGLISRDQQYQHSSLVEQTVSSYQRMVRSQGLWMSYSHSQPFTNQNFLQLESLMEREKRVRGGSCYYWAGSHYRMFDGTLLSLPASCGHVLVKENRDNIFTITTRSVLRLISLTNPIRSGPWSVTELPPAQSISTLRSRRRSSLSPLTAGSLRSRSMDSP